MATRFMLTCWAAFGALSVGAGSSSGLRSKTADVNTAAQKTGKDLKRHSMLVESPQAVEQNLVICNAYASPHSLDIVRVRDRHALTEGSPLKYKECQDFTVPLEEGDQLDFKAGSLDVGTFYATGLPKSSASLLLIPHRRSPHAVGVSFESHAFADLNNPQIAVIDAFRSKKDKNQGSVKITESVADAKGDKAPSKVEEELKFNSVVAVNPGEYELSLTGTGEHIVGKVPLSANGAAKYVVMRLGIEDETGKPGKYPQELVVFPQSGSSRLTCMSAFLVLAAAAFLRL